MDASQLGLGQILTSEKQRDAIHVAVIPVVAAQDLRPGSHVRVVNGQAEYAGAGGPATGVIDPFLDAMVMRGQRCWLFLLPGTVTGLHHEWSHPAFSPPPAPVADSDDDYDDYRDDSCSGCD